MSALTCLSLEGNPLRLAGARALLECLDDITQLQKLNLQRCSLGDEGCEAVQQAWEATLGREESRTLCVDEQDYSVR